MHLMVASYCDRLVQIRPQTLDRSRRHHLYLVMPCLSTDLISCCYLLCSSIVLLGGMSKDCQVEYLMVRHMECSGVSWLTAFVLTGLLLLADISASNRLT